MAAPANNPAAFKEGHIDENVFQIYGPRRSKEMAPPEELIPKIENYEH